ncbi:hypothetical protein RIF29_34267 [Crotalaria pallida]|uniref:RNase H type-1 domain-containing protein n=1 Tax=Crotalaria pallida TaxID=3830 RepID=A0AAN9HTG1_CROPI
MKLLRCGFKINLGAGGVSFMFDNWLDVDPIFFTVPFVDIHDIALTVLDVGRDQGSKLHGLYTILPVGVKYAISSTFFGTSYEGPNTVAWRRDSEPCWVRWEPPPPSFFCLNVDGSIFGSLRRAGFSDVLCDHFGHWIFGFSKFVEVLTSLHAELLTIFIGLKLAWDKGFCFIICQSDSMPVVSLIACGVFPHQHYVVLIHAITHLLGKDWDVSLRHLLREGNQVAD